jgi:two-component system, OmpR family, phosphate regulon sensor histidine kinase PhoR
MFWRLFATYVLFVAAALISVGLLVLQRADSLFYDLFLDVIIAVLIILIMAIPTAYFLARRFTNSIDALTEGAKRMAEGEFSQDIQVEGGREIAFLAETMNQMRHRLGQLITELKVDQDQLRTILSGMDEGVIAFDASRKILFVNQRALDLLDFRDKESTARTLDDLMTTEPLKKFIRDGLQSPGPYTKGTKERTLSMYLTRLPSSQTSSMVLVLDDTTERTEFERLRQDFVANVSHELKTPLHNIQSGVEALNDGAVDDPAPRKMFLSQIDDEAKRLHALVVDLLHLAKMESGYFNVELEAVLVEDAVHTCLDRHRTRAESKGHSLHGVALAGCPPTLAVWANDESFAQILDNLVDNAIKYTNPGGRVTVRWTADEQQVVIEVEDTGVGIPQDRLPRVFERFFRVDKARSREMGGTGLGLAIVKHMVQLLHGSVRAESVLGKGTTFRVCLPRGTPKQD